MISPYFLWVLCHLDLVLFEQKFIDPGSTVAQGKLLVQSNVLFGVCMFHLVLQFSPTCTWTSPHTSVTVLLHQIFITLFIASPPIILEILAWFQCQNFQYIWCSVCIQIFARLIRCKFLIFEQILVFGSSQRQQMCAGERVCDVTAEEASQGQNKNQISLGEQNTQQTQTHSRY